MNPAGLAILLFLLGLPIGSFLTVVAHRVPRGDSVIGGRSLCPVCGVQIAAYDNVPVFSWLLLRGKARCCGEPISGSYPATELAVAALFAATGLAFADETARLLLGLVLVATLVTVTLTDLERRVIPNKVLVVATVLGLGIVIAGDLESLPERAIAAAAAGGVLFAAALAYPGGMGLGDVKLAATMGLFLGRAVAPALLVALLAGSLVGVWLIARHGPPGGRGAIPFGPFLALGGLVGLFAGEALVEWYLDVV